MTAFRRAATLYFSDQFARFLVVGGIAFLANWSSRVLFNTVVSYGWSIVLAYAVGMGTAFLLCRKYVFPLSTQPLRNELSFFVIFNVAAFPVVWVAAYWLGEHVLPGLMPRGVTLALGHAIALAIPVFVNFALHKFITFRAA
jgi:putative flippase GtrA